MSPATRPPCFSQSWRVIGCAADGSAGSADGVSAGACAPACASGQTNCGGVCVNTQTDTDHCGACNNACKGKMICVAGNCTGQGGS